MLTGFKSSVAVAALGAGLALVPAVASAEKGVFRYAEEVKMITLDPEVHTGGGLSYLRPVYEALFSVTPDNKVVPFLATGIRQDGLHISLTLREGVKFSDGTPFNAEAVVANFNSEIKKGVLTALKPISSVKATGDYSVEVTLSRPDPSFERDMTGEPGMMISRKALTDPALDRNPVGTGPYVYSRTLSREGVVCVYTPNPGYWDPKAVTLDKVEIYELPDNTARLNALKTGQVDVGIWLASPQAAIIEHTPGLKLLRNSVGGYTYQLIIQDRDGTKVPAFADKRVRQAMNYAMNRPAFIRAIDFGLSTPAYQSYPKGSWAHDPKLVDSYKYNLAKAKTLMKEAGYAKGFSFEMPSIPIFQSRLEAVQGFLRDINIDMKIVPVEPGTLARRSMGTDFPATNLVWQAGTDPSYLGSAYINADASYNPYHVKPGPEITKLLQEGLQSADPKVRAPIYQKLLQKLGDESYLISISAPPVLFGASDAIANNPTMKMRPEEDTVFLRGLKIEK